MRLYGSSSRVPGPPPVAPSPTVRSLPSKARPVVGPRYPSEIPAAQVKVARRQVLAPRRA